MPPEWSLEGSRGVSRPMQERVKGELDATGLRVGIVVSRWNQSITDQLTNGALRTLISLGIAEEDYSITEVPGAMEIPLALDLLAKDDDLDALIALGCVVEGETAHFEHVSRAAMEGITQVSLKYQIPIGCGLLTTYTMEQAEARAGLDEHNKGTEAALAAIEMATLAKRLS